MAETATKIKQFVTPELYTSLIIILVGFASFGLGRLSVLSHDKSTIQITDTSVGQGTSASSFSEEYNSTETRKEASGNGSEPESGQLVGSVNGSKYHLPWCPGAQRIKEENEIWFDSVEDALARGYEPAANCKGLE